MSISIHALREEGDGQITEGVSEVAISIHALREEGDREGRGQLILGGISIHALREEGDTHTRRGDRWAWEFLSTPSARRATGAV